MNLIDYAENLNKKKEAPLAGRMRPVTLDEVVGQSHIIGEGKLLYRAIKADKISSIIFYGPPGTGKTTLASVIAGATSSDFKQINATASGKRDMMDVVEAAKENLAMTGRKTILFIDEIHRFNKSQQDYLLPFVEDGTLILIGATTENPYFEVNSALVSRSMVLELKPLESSDIAILIRRAVTDKERGMGVYNAEITDEAVEFLSEAAGGDARNALNALEIGVLTTAPDDRGIICIDLSVAEECIQKRAIGYDKKGDSHYDTISAFIKSMRGSDPDAAVYYLARMLYAGEDVDFIARRIMICAAEDVGMANPQALVVAAAAAEAVHRLGMPEARIVLAEAVINVATSPKSNSAINAIDSALESVEHTQAASMPPYLKDAHYSSASKLGHGVGYKYAHNYQNHYVDQQYLPDELKDTVFYVPGNLGYEKKADDFMKSLKKHKD